jgi:hypothetical protein
MKRFVETSRGWIELEFRPEPFGRLFRRLGAADSYGVIVTPFAADGWSRSDETGWLSGASSDGQSLPAFLADVAGIPIEEAEEVAAESVEEWQRRR